MKKFDQKITEAYERILGLEQDASQQQPGLPQDGGPTAPPAAPAAPAAPEPEPLTSEGKMFLVQLALKALAVDPDTISEQDKALFEEPVTTANADQIADRIRQIVDGL